METWGQMDRKDRGTRGQGTDGSKGQGDTGMDGCEGQEDMGTEGPGDMGTNGPKGLEDTGTEGPEGQGDTGYRDTADRWVGMWGAGLAPRCAPCPLPPAGHPHPRGTQQGATLGARPHTRVFATRGWAHARTRVCVCRAAGGSRAARASPRGYFYPAPLAPVAPILPQQPLRGRWGTQRGGQRPRCQLHGTARPFLPHNMVIPAP